MVFNDFVVKKKTTTHFLNCFNKMINIAIVILNLYVNLVMPLKFHLPVLEFNVLLVQIKLEINI